MRIRPRYIFFIDLLQMKLNIRLNNNSDNQMAKKGTMLFRLLSSAGTGFTYLGQKSTLKTLNKVSVRKYDPLVNEYVVFNEVKLPSGKTFQKKKTAK